MIYISKKITQFLYKRGIVFDEIDLFEFGLRSILRNVFIFASSTILSIYFDILLEFLLFNLMFVLLRQLTGGYHAKSPIICFLISTILISIVPYLISLQKIEYYNDKPVIILLSIWVLLFGLHNKPSKKLKLIIFILMCNLVVFLFAANQFANIIVAALAFDLLFLIMDFWKK